MNIVVKSFIALFAISMLAGCVGTKDIPVKKKSNEVNYVAVPNFDFTVNEITVNASMISDCPNYSLLRKIENVTSYIPLNRENKPINEYKKVEACRTIDNHVKVKFSTKKLVSIEMINPLEKGNK